MSITIDRKSMLDMIVTEQRFIDDIDDNIHRLQIDRAQRQHKIDRIEETLKALNRDITTIEVVELKRGYIPIPGGTRQDKAYMKVRFAIIMQEKFDAFMPVVNEWIAMQASPSKWTRKKCDTGELRKTTECITRGIDDNGFEVIEHADICYMSMDDYQKFYMQSTGKWYDKDLIRQGLKANLIAD